ncbi:helix-turn-helix domain-containing protein [Alkalihalobacillus deserti]|uniref:helix-turn-helix domain-containing protein n=1 Tax=Alkalihalobacillus deserti TaxID=2879466 RepID=UPI001D136AFB|nr:helix-turn-helix domain-containing protein [Alkalihalobacillus deserti]
MKNLDELPVVLTVSDVKEVLGIGLSQAYDLVNSNQFHVTRVNRRILISKEVFLNWLNGKRSI